MASEQAFTVMEADAGCRLDRFVSQRTGLSRHGAVRLIEEGRVRVGPRRGRKGGVLVAGDVVAVEALGPLTDAQETPPVPQPELPLEVLHEDAHLIVVNKPAGWPAHPLRAGERGTLASALVARYPECATAAEHAREGGLCHRLDVHTTGAILAARDGRAWRAARAAFHAGKVEKEYLALCIGTAQAEQGTVNQPLLAMPGRPDRMKVAEAPEDVYHADAMDAVTRFEVLRRAEGYTLVRAWAQTGRRHQIRAHLSYLGLPLYGDHTYGAPPMSDEVIAALGPDDYAGAQGQMLHASALRLPAHEHEGLSLGPLLVLAPLPRARRRLLEILLGPEFADLAEIAERGA